jgi:hypothetical protein
MLRAIPVFAALSALAVGLAGCQSQQAYAPKSSQTVVLTGENRTPLVSLPVITEIKFVLPGPTPGSNYAWEVVGNNIKTLVQTQDLTYTADPKRPDGGFSSVTFYGLKPGRSVLRFVLIKPADRIAEPVDHFTVLVMIKDTDAQP